MIHNSFANGLILTPESRFRFLSGTFPVVFKRLMERFDRLAGRGVIDDEFYDELEEALLAADTPFVTVTEILAELRKAVREEKIVDAAGMKERLKKAIADRFRIPGEAPGLDVADEGPTVFVFVGVNGAGKTTSIGKLAYKLRKRGFSVLLAAGDTFRAAAIDQLEIWAERTESQIVKGQPGADSAAVLFDAIQAAKARGIDFVLADTAGRQHSKGALMAELEKVIRVAQKGLGRKPDEVLLVLDANAGQNVLRQAEEFGRSAGVTGIVLSKLDGTSRGGAMMGVFREFRIPVKLVGVGEKPEDLLDFKPDRFAAALFD